MVFALVLFCLFGQKERVMAYSDALYEIEDYEIKIKPASDGALYMTYHIAWKVLDDESEGALTWVKIGIPNEYVEDVRPLSDSVKSAKYKSYDGGDYVRVDLDRKYYAGEVVDIDFSIHQHHMYEMAGEDKDDYFWETALDPGDRYYIRVYYPAGVFTEQDDAAKSARQATDVVLIALVVAVPVLICVLALIFRARVAGKDHYTKDRGMGGIYTWTHHTGGHGGGGGCACACACACAGGGRAGCARKDFYGTRLETLKVRQAILNYEKNSCQEK